MIVYNNYYNDTELEVGETKMQLFASFKIAAGDVVFDPALIHDLH